MSISTDIDILARRIKALEDAHQCLRWVANQLVRDYRKPEQAHHANHTVEFNINQLEDVLNDATQVTKHDYISWTNAVSKITGLEDLDGDQKTDGYSLDTCFDMFSDGLTPEQAAAEIDKERSRR